MPIKCGICEKNAILKRPKTGDALCKDCFYWAFEEEVHKTIIDARLFKPGDRVAVGASGGKDSTVLAYVMKALNERYSYGVELVLLSVDEGITGYRDDSLETVKRNKQQYGLPLKIISYEELYGWTMDAIVKQIGLNNNCTFCGVFRRQALDRGAMLLKCNKIVTGHNADDIAETVIMNILRGDIARLRRCTAITTGTEGTLPRSKPFKYTYEKEIVMYAYFKKLDYFSTECIYSPNAYRGHARAYIKDAEKIRPSAIIDIIHSGESLSIKKEVKMPVQGTCTRCGYISSQAVCKACMLLEGLNKGLPRLGIGKTQRVRRLVGSATCDDKESVSSSASEESTSAGLDKKRDNQNVFGSRVRVDAVSKVAELELAEKEKMKDKVEKIIKHGCNVFINRQLIYNYPEQLFADQGIMAIEHADFEGVERLALVTGGEIVSTFDSPESVKLGHCDLIEEVMIGEDPLIKFSGVALGEACTIVLRGATQQILDEADRSLHDALCVLSQTVEETATVFGGGSSEMLMANAVSELAAKTPGKEAVAIESFAKALRQLPTIISDNAGYDSADLVAKLRALHTEGKKTMGLNMDEGEVGDMSELGITESLRVKRQILVSASEAAEMILRVDDIIKAAPRQRGGDHCM